LPLLKILVICLSNLFFAVFSPSFRAAFTSDNWRIANFERPHNPLDFGAVRFTVVRFFATAVVRFFVVIFRLTVDFLRLESVIFLIFNKLIFRFA